MGIIEQMLTKYFIGCKEDVYNAMRNVRTMTLPNLYASKIHAFLFRAWKERVKGRDWFDFEWYVKNNVSLNLEHLFHRIRHFGNLQQNYLTKEYLQELLLF